MAASLTILIATAGSNSLLDRTLMSLNECIKPDSYLGTVIIENGIKCNAEQIVQKYRDSLNATYYYVEKGNKSAALNHAMSQIQDKNTLIFFTDDDARFDKNILMVYDRVLQLAEKNYYFGGRSRVDYEKKPAEWLLSVLPTSSSDWPPSEETIQQTHHFLGINWSAYLKDLVEVGGFDPRFGPGTVPRRIGQEHNMQSRLYKAGLKPYYLPDAIVWHYVPIDKSNLSFALNRKLQYGMRNGMQMRDEGKKPVFIWRYSIYMYLFSLGKLCVSLLTFSTKKIAIHFSSLYSITGYIKGYFLKS